LYGKIEAMLNDKGFLPRINKMRNDFIETQGKNATEAVRMIVSLLAREQIAEVDASTFKYLNEIAYGKRPQWMSEKLKDFKKSTHVNVYCDHNLSEKQLDDYLVVLKGRLDMNEVNNRKSPKNFFITDFFEDMYLGLYTIKTHNIYIRTITNNDFDKTLAHEMMHYTDDMENDDFTRDLEISKRLKRNITKNIREYATTDRAEFVTCFNQNIVEGKFSVMEDKRRGGQILRAYQSQFDKPITKDELQKLVDLYTKIEGPEHVLSEPPVWDKHAMHDLGKDYIEVPFKHSKKSKTKKSAFLVEI
jgi:hypothetical protein